MKCTKLLASLILFTTFLTCNKNPTKPKNIAPQIQDISCSQGASSTNSLPNGGQTNLSVTVLNSDNDQLSYIWESSSGYFPNGADKPSVAWKAPYSDNEEPYNIKLRVSDGSLSDTTSINIYVTAGQKEWTILLYDDADFSNAYDPLTDFSECVSTNSEVNYLVLRDNIRGGGNYYLVNDNHYPKKLLSLGEVNMGASLTLENFLKYAKTNYPANRYIMAIYDHGSGWWGTCWDVGSNDDNLTAFEMNEALSSAGGVDLLLFTAPCLMGSIEHAYQVRNSAKYYIGSEDLSGFLYWTNILNALDLFIKENSYFSTRIISEEIIKLHDKNKNKAILNGINYGDYITMSAIDLAEINDVVITFTAVTNFYNNNFDKFKSFPIADVKVVYNWYLDYKNLLEELNSFETNSNAKALLQQAIESFEKCVFAECHGDSCHGENGLNICYEPNLTDSTEIYYEPYGIGLDFKKDCTWDDLIFKSLNGKQAFLNEDRLSKLLKQNGYYWDKANLR